MINGVFFNNFLWRFAEQCGSQGIQVFVLIVLARMIEPSDFGTIAIVTVIINFLQVFVDSGLASALIQKKDADDIDFSSVFFSNLCLSILIYLIIYSISPYIAEIYNKEELVSIIRVVSLTLIVAAIRNVQQAYISKNLLFQKLFLSTIIASLVSGLGGMICAYLGFGIWSLVVQQISSVCVSSLILWRIVRWRPIFIFSFKRMKQLFSFGWKILCSALIDVGYSNITQLTIGYAYTHTDLAFYNRGQQFPNLIITNINNGLNSVLFPSLSNIQNDIKRVKSLTRDVIRISGFIVWPLVTLLFICAEEIVTLLLTEKWIPCVPYMQCFCFIYGFWPLHTANLNAIKAMGRSDIFLRLELIKKTYGILMLLATFSLGPFAIVIGNCILGPVSAILNAYPNANLLKYTFVEQISDIYPSMIIAISMGIIIFNIKGSEMAPEYSLVIKCILGIIIYVVLSYICNQKVLYKILNEFKSVISNRMH